MKPSLGITLSLMLFASLAQGAAHLRRGILDNAVNNLDLIDHLELIDSMVNSNPQDSENRNANTKASGPGDNSVLSKQGGEGIYKKQWRKMKRGVIDNALNNIHVLDHLDLFNSAVNSDEQSSENSNANTKASGPGDNSSLMKQGPEGYYYQDDFWYSDHHDPMGYPQRVSYDPAYEFFSGGAPQRMSAQPVYVPYGKHHSYHKPHFIDKRFELLVDREGQNRQNRQTRPFYPQRLRSYPVKRPPYQKREIAHTQPEHKYRSDSERTKHMSQKELVAARMRMVQEMLQQDVEDQGAATIGKRSNPADSINDQANTIDSNFKPIS
ncbi:uncharacterized protein VTP21DRAFT_1579 [Calcarisporiella thermophila]|uniref:uncharacterized protein n=1 Tax=Calcarisporiella thermophila TaxID=911321 RepID=UPI0037443ED8